MKRHVLTLAACVALSSAPAFAEPTPTDFAAEAAPSAPVVPAPAPQALPAHVALKAPVAALKAPVAALKAPVVALKAPVAVLKAPATASVTAITAAAPAVAAPATGGAATAPAAPALAPAPLAAASVAGPAAAAKGPAVSPAWLRADKPLAKPALEVKQGPNPLRVGGMLLVVATLGGVAFYAKRKRQGVKRSEPKGQLKVLGTTRVGAKASAVIVEVAGKRILLGVTDQHVNTLAWLDDEANAAADEREPSQAGSGVRAVDDVAAAGPSGFLKLLRNAVASSAARPGSAIDEVARTTRDEVHLSRREPEAQRPSRRDEPQRSPRNDADDSELMEGQVMGLSKRRRESSS